jgi:hypothetical protein
MGLNDATRVLGVIDQRIEQNTGSNITQTYGQIASVSGSEASVWLAGSRELAAITGEISDPMDGVRIPAWMVVHVDDYCRIALVADGGSWIEEIIPRAPYARMAIDITEGQIQLGSGLTPPMSGSEGQVMSVSSDGSLEFVSRFSTTFVPFVYNSPAGTATVEMQPIDAEATHATPRLPMPWEFSIVGVTVRSSAARTAGTMTVTPTINGIATNFSAVLDGTNTTTGTAKGSRFVTVNQGIAGQEIGVRIVTSGFTPTTAYITVGLFVIIHYDDPIALIGNSFTADAVLKASVIGGFSFTADAVFKSTTAATFTANAVLAAIAGPPPGAGSANLGTTGAVLGTIIPGNP